MARNAVAMPAADWKKRRRDIPRRLAAAAPISFTRASNSRCLRVCGDAMNSSLETDWTGIGEANRSSAGERWRSSSWDSMLMEAPRAADDRPMYANPVRRRNARARGLSQLDAHAHRPPHIRPRVDPRPHPGGGRRGDGRAHAVRPGLDRVAREGEGARDGGQEA